MVDLFMFFIAIILLYSFIPFALSRWASFGVYKNAGKEAAANREIALTFDDGPNPEYTVKLLDLLKQYQIKASFFVVGSKAEKYPEIIKRMQQEGHIIGVHNYVHQSNWFMTPWKVQQGLERTSQYIERITGTKPIYYRPPWGMLNLFDLFTHKNYQIILWSLMVGDWRSKGGSKKIEDRLLKGVRAGDIIVLHDSGETWGADEDAPRYTIQALKTVLQKLSSKGFTFIRIDQLNEARKRA